MSVNLQCTLSGASSRLVSALAQPQQWVAGLGCPGAQGPCCRRGGRFQAGIARAAAWPMPSCPTCRRGCIAAPNWHQDSVGHAGCLAGLQEC